MPAKFLSNALAHDIAGDHFTVGNVHAFGFQVTLLQPGQDFVVVAVGTHGIQVVDLGFHGPVFAVDFHVFGAVYQRIATGSGGLEAGENDAVARVRQQGFQVVQHAATAGHAAGGDDHAGVAGGIQLDGFFHRAHKLGFAIEIGRAHV